MCVQVADCVCLMSLDKLDAIPVDTHVWQLALREYKNEAKIANVKSITDTVYRQIGAIRFLLLVLFLFSSLCSYLFIFIMKIVHNSITYKINIEINVEDKYYIFSMYYIFS